MKSPEEYDRLFEDLLEYSDFRNVNEIVGDSQEKTQQNLKQYFKSIQENANNKGRRFKISKPLVFQMSQSLKRIKGDKKMNNSQTKLKFKKTRKKSRLQNYLKKKEQKERLKRLQKK